MGPGRRVLLAGALLSVVVTAGLAVHPAVRRGQAPSPADGTADDDRAVEAGRRGLPSAGSTSSWRRVLPGVSDHAAPHPARESEPTRLPGHAQVPPGFTVADDRILSDTLRAIAAISAADRAASRKPHHEHGERTWSPDLPATREGSEWVHLTDLASPVAVQLTATEFPLGRVRIGVTKGNGRCTLAVDDGQVFAGGRLVPPGALVEIDSGTELTWTGAAGIRLEKPSSLAIPGGNG